MKAIEDIADLIELRVWAGGQSIPISSVKEELESGLADVVNETPEELAQNIFDELVARESLLGDAYPFSCDGYKLALKTAEAQSSTYLFCIALSHLPAVEIENEQRALQFETVVKEAAARFFGGNGLRIGAPWRAVDVEQYSDLLDKVIALVPELGQRLRDTAPGGGDAGWDILIVKSFRDNRFPRFVALGNCATGRRDWKRKGMEVQPTLWWSYFSHDHWSVQVTFFAVPFQMDDDSRLRKLSATNMTFDRIRICELAPESVPEAATWLAGQRENAMNLSLI